MGKIPTFGIGSVGVRIGETEGIGGGEASAAVELSLEDLYIFRKLSSALAAGDRQILHTPDVLRLFQKNARTERLIFVETLSFVDKSVPHLRLHDYVNHLYPPSVPMSMIYSICEKIRRSVREEGKGSICNSQKFNP